MKSLIKAVALAVVVVAPVVSFAQSEQPLTRAQVTAQLKQLEDVGYKPAVATDAVYPADIQAAEARVAEKNAAQADTTGYGTTATGSSQTGGNGAASPAQ